MGVPNIERLSSPPREVPLLLRFQLLFGGALAQMGWFFFGFGMIFFWLFIPNCDWQSLQYIGAQTEYEQGVVGRVEATHFSEGGSKTRRGRTVYAYYYTFMRGGVILYEGVSYSSTASLGYGSAINVEYPQGNPQASRIKGLRSAPFDLWPVFFVMLFPGIGLVFVIIGLTSGKKSFYLLGNGVLGYGQLESVSYANMHINNKNVYKLIFRYMGTNGLSYKVKTLTEKAEILQDEEAEQLLFDRSDQSNSVMLDTLPGGIIVDSGGSIRPKSYFYAMGVSIIPLIVVLSQIAFVYYIFTK